MLRATNYYCTINNNKLFEPISFDLSKHPAMLVVGANGSGKTTLLRSIAGLHYNTMHCQHDFGDKTQYDLQQQIVFCDQKTGLNPQLTVFDNLRMMQLLSGHHQIDFNAVLNQFGLNNVKYKEVNLLSAGQKQRCQLARLVIFNRKIWLLDEPLSNLDQDGSQLLVDLCEQHLAQSNCIILTSHHLPQLLQWHSISINSCCN